MDWLTEWGPFITSAPGWITMIVLGLRYLGRKWDAVKSAERAGRLKAEDELLQSEKRNVILEEQIGYLREQLHRNAREAAEGGD